MVNDANVERVQIRKNPKDILNFVPPKGIDINFYQVDPEETGRTKLYDVAIITSPLNPEPDIKASEPRHITELLSSWRNLVSDKSSQQNIQPLKHKIVTVIDRPEVKANTQLQEKINKLSPEQITKDEDGNDIAEFVVDVTEL